MSIIRIQYNEKIPSQIYKLEGSNELRKIDISKLFRSHIPLELIRYLNNLKVYHSIKTLEYYFKDKDIVHTSIYKYLKRLEELGLITIIEKVDGVIKKEVKSNTILEPKKEEVLDYLKTGMFRSKKIKIKVLEACLELKTLSEIATITDLTVREVDGILADFNKYLRVGYVLNDKGKEYLKKLKNDY